jgi:hypothetical protein
MENEMRWWEAKERPDKKEAIMKIENRTKDDVIKLLKHNGIGGVRGHRWHDYSKAKKLCFEGLFIDSDIYDKQIKWICDYLKI